MREGEQFATTEFTPQDRVYIAKILDRIGVDYIELVNPMAGKQAVQDAETIANLGLDAKICVHTRCHIADVTAAVNTGVDAINVYMATSPILSRHSHGKGIDVVVEMATEVVKFIQDHDIEVRFSCEDSFRSDMSDCLTVYKAMDALGVQRVGVADTVGIATPAQVSSVIGSVRGAIKPETGIEFHTHNDTGCCVANALVALEAGATHIDTSVLGIGERNGITPLGGFLARMYTLDSDAIKSRYNLGLIGHLEKYVAQRSHVSIPFNNYVTGSSAFTHKAGVHSKAVMANPAAYEVIDPVDFGVERRIELAHRLTGWNAMKQRCQDLCLDIPDDKLKIATVMIKDLSDERTIGIDDLDRILNSLSTRAKPSSTFIKWGADNPNKPSAQEMYMEETKEAFEEALQDTGETRPSQTYRFTGHLFDKAVLNRLLDLAVDSPCDFRVLKLTVPNDNDLESSAQLQIFGSQEQMVELRMKFENFIKNLENVAGTHMTEVRKGRLKRYKRGQRTRRSMAAQRSKNEV